MLSTPMCESVLRRSGHGVFTSDLAPFDELAAGFDNDEMTWNCGSGVIAFCGALAGIRADLRSVRTF